MSDFKIVKCKKCDAALTQMQGETLTSCVQCGYQFPLVKNNQNIKTTLMNKAATPEMTNLLKKLNQIKASKTKNTSPEVAGVMRSLKQKYTSTSKSNKTKTVIPAKKKSNPLGSLIVWIILVIVIRVLISH